MSTRYHSFVCLFTISQSLWLVDVKRVSTIYLFIYLLLSYTLEVKSFPLLQCMLSTYQTLDSLPLFGLTCTVLSFADERIADTSVTQLIYFLSEIF